MDSSNRMRNELVGSWHTLTGQSEKLAGELLDDPDRYFNGVVTALQGQLEESIGDSQAQVAGDALRSQWSGLSQETQGQVLTQWGEWTDDPDDHGQRHRRSHAGQARSLRRRDHAPGERRGRQ